jgi:hypothetical protein
MVRLFLNDFLIAAFETLASSTTRCAGWLILYVALVTRFTLDAGTAASKATIDVGRVLMRMCSLNVLHWSETSTG